MQWYTMANMANTVGAPSNAHYAPAGAQNEAVTHPPGDSLQDPGLPGAAHACRYAGSPRHGPAMSCHGPASVLPYSCHVVIAMLC